MSRLLLPILLAAALVGAVVSLAAPVDGAFYPRVIGGEPAPPDAYGWMAALVQTDVFDYAEGQFCGGILISPEWVLTAAHCVEDRDLNDFRIVMASDLDAPSEVLAPAAILMHPTYFEHVYRGGDIALIQLERRLEEVEPARLNTNSAYASQQSQGRILGWGRTSFDSNAPNLHPSKLQQADLQILSRGTLNTLPYYGGVIRPEFIPVGQSNPLRAAFSGDSGGPLLVQDTEGGWLLAGVASWGSGGCGDAYDHITMYSDVAYHADWIEEVVSISEQYRAPATAFDFRYDDVEGTTHWMLPLWPRVSGETSIDRWYTGNYRISTEHRGINLYRGSGNHSSFVAENGRVLLKTDLSGLPQGKAMFATSPKLVGSEVAPGPFPLKVFQQARISSRLSEYNGFDVAFRVNGFQEGRKYWTLGPGYRDDEYRVFKSEGGILTDVLDGGAFSQQIAYDPGDEAWILANGGGHWFMVPDDISEAELGHPFEGTLSTDSHPYRRPGERVASVKVVLGEAMWAREIALEIASEFDAEIAILAQFTGKTLAYLDDDGRNGTETILVYENTLEKSAIRISNFDPDEYGTFTLSARSHISKSSLRRGDSERRALTSADEVSYQPDEPTLYYESIPLSLDGSTARVAITVEGIGGFLPFFGVFEIPGGTLMASSGGSYCESPEIVFTPKSTHTYELWVVTLDESDLNGNYDVSVATKTSDAVGAAAPQARSAKAEQQIRFRQLGARAHPTAEEIQQALVDAYLNSKHAP